MKIKEVLHEGVFQDLASLGRAEQDRLRQSGSAAMGNAMGKVGGAIKGALGKIPGASKIQGYAQAIQAAAKDVNIQQMADKLAAAWEAESKRINAGMPAGQVMTVDEYKQRAAAWLEQMMQGQVRVDEKNMDPYVTQTDAKQIREYLAKHFLPAYKVSQVPAAPQIPNGYQVLVKGGSAGKTTIPNEIYTWSNGRWMDKDNRPVIAGSSLHNSLTQDAMSTVQSKQPLQAI